MKKNMILLLFAFILMVSCYPDKPLYYSDLDLVFTNYEKDFDFMSKGTYAIPDKIVKITGNLNDGESPEYIKEPYNSEILQTIESNMTAMGWTKAVDPESADLALLPAVWTNTTVYYWYDYWCWYYYYYCGWGYSYQAVSSYTTGTLVMALVAAGDDYVDPSGVWVAACNGLLSGAYDVKRVNTAINQAFEQSPYLSVK
jgi:hypothetical protein